MDCRKFSVSIFLLCRNFSAFQALLTEIFLYFKEGDTMTIYERIESLRKLKNISQGKLEKELGFSNGSISKWKNSMPTPERLKRLAEYFGVTVDYLMTGEDDTKKPVPELTTKDERDIAKDLDRIIGEIRKGEDGPLYYNGIEIDNASINLLQNAIEYALRETNKENKEKYNPYKNKK